MAAPSQAAGSAWTVRLAPTGSLTRAVSGQAIACPDSAFCVQLGYGDTSTGLLADVYADGTATTQTLPVPGDADPDLPNYLFDLTCRSRTWCVAVGEYPTGSAYRPLIDTYVDGTWNAVAGPGDGNELERVACNAAECLATGSRFADGFDHEYLTALDGARPWAAQHFDTGIYGVRIDDPTCPKDAACFAQLSVESAPEPDKLVVQQADGTWTTKNFALPMGAQPYPFTVGQLSCVGPRCYGVGTYRALDSTNQLVAETLDITGTGFAGRVHSVRIATPTALTPVALDLAPTGTSCTRTRVDALCGAAVDVTYGGLPSAGLVRFWAGSWHARTAALPAGGRPKSEKLDSVSCAGYHCAAVGSYKLDAGGTGRAVVQDWTPGGWRGTALGVPSGLQAKDDLILDDVSCADDGHCLADGAVGYRAHPEPLRMWTATYG